MVGRSIVLHKKLTGAGGVVSWPRWSCATIGAAKPNTDRNEVR